MRKLITILLLLSTTAQAQQYYKLINGNLFSKEEPLHIIEVKGEVFRNERGVITEYRVLNMWGKMTARKYEKLTNDEKGFFEYLDYKYAVKKRLASDSIKRIEQKIQQANALIKEIKIKKTNDSLFVVEQNKVMDRLRLEKEKNVNGWSNEDFVENYYKMSPINLVVVERHVKVGGYLQTTLDKKYACLLLPISDRNISYINCDANNLVSFNVIKPSDIIEVLNYGENGTVLLKNKKTDQLYIGDYNVIFHQHNAFDVNSVLFSKIVKKEEPKVLSVEEIAIQNRYKNILTTYKLKLARINAICNKKAYEVKDFYGVVRYNTKLFTQADKKEYNQLDLWIEKANSTLWVTVKEDEYLLNENNNIMEELLANDKWLNLKVGLEQSQSIEHIYN